MFGFIYIQDEQHLRSLTPLDLQVRFDCVSQPFSGTYAKEVKYFIVSVNLLHDTRPERSNI